MSKVITGAGSDLPARVVTNDEIEASGVGWDRARAGRSLHEWSVERLGVSSRHRVAPGEGTSDLGARAARRALEDAGVSAADVGLLVMSTFTPDHRQPSSAALVQAALGASFKFFELNAACSGFVDAVLTAAALMDAMQVSRALVVSSDAFSIHCHPRDFRMQCLFGDGAGAVVLEDMPGSPYGLRGFHTAGDGSRGKALWVPGGGTKEPASEEMVRLGRHYGAWDHQAVESFAIEKLVESCRAGAARAGWNVEDVEMFVPHQAGRGLIEAGRAALGVPPERFFLNLDHVGNASGASIPIALDEAARSGTLHAGDRVVTPAMGAGLAWGALAFVWGTGR